MADKDVAGVLGPLLPHVARGRRDRGRHPRGRCRRTRWRARWRGTRRPAPPIETVRDAGAAVARAGAFAAAGRARRLHLPRGPAARGARRRRVRTRVIFFGGSPCGRRPLHDAPPEPLPRAPLLPARRRRGAGAGAGLQQQAVPHRADRRAPLALLPARWSSRTPRSRARSSTPTSSTSTPTPTCSRPPATCSTRRPRRASPPSACSSTRAPAPAPSSPPRAWPRSATAPTRACSAAIEPDVYFYGTLVEKTGEDRYKVTKGGFTTCVQPTPRWEMTAGLVHDQRRRLRHPPQRRDAREGRAGLLPADSLLPDPGRRPLHRLPAPHLRPVHLPGLVGEQRLLLGHLAQPGPDGDARLVHLARPGLRHRVPLDPLGHGERQHQGLSAEPEGRHAERRAVAGVAERPGERLGQPGPAASGSPAAPASTTRRS